MAKKHKKRLKADAILNLKYRWEFLRRCPKYREDFSNLLLSLRKKGLKKKYNALQSLDFYDCVICRLDIQDYPYFKKTYNLGFPLNPDIPFENLVLQFNKQERGKERIRRYLAATHFLALTFDYKFNIVDIKHPLPVTLITKRTWNKTFGTSSKKKPCYTNLKGQPLKERDIPEKIMLEIDLTYPPREIDRALKEYVAEFKDVRKYAGLDKHRTRWNEFDEYLEVYDLRTKEELTFREIAARLYPEDYKKAMKRMESKGKDIPDKEKLFQKIFQATNDENLAYKKAYGHRGEKSSNKAVQRAIDRFYEAERLVKGGYKEIR